MNRAAYLRVTIHRATVFIAVDGDSCIVTAAGMTPSMIPIALVSISMVMVPIAVGVDEGITGGE